MALLYTDSADHYATADVLAKWDFATTNSYSVTTGRTGNGLKIPAASIGPNILKNLTADYAGLVVGFAFYMSILPYGNTTLCSFADTGTCQTSLCVDNVGRLYLTRGSSASSPGFASPGNAGTSITGGSSAPGLVTNGQWYYGELKVTFGLTGTATVRLGNTQIITVSGQPTISSANASANQLVLWGAQNNNGANDNSFDDLYLASTSGGGVVSFLGDCTAGCLFSDSDYAVSLTTSTGSTHYVLVNGTTPDGDATYNYSATPGDNDVYGLQNLPGTVVTVLGLQSCMYARKDDGSARSVAPRFSDGVTNTNGTTVSLPQTYGYRLQAWDTSPVDASALSVAKVNALKCGMYVVS